MQIRNRRDIQILRAFALIGVLFFHLGPKWFPNGYLGVDIFFVISGFLLASKIQRIGSQELTNRAAKSELLRFLKRRFFRLAPALSVSVALGLIVTLIAAPVSEHSRFSTQAILGLFFLGNLGAQHFDSNYFNPSPSLFLHFWSLGVEFQLYVFFALGSFIKGRCRIKIKANKAILAISALSFLPVIFNRFADYFLNSVQIIGLDSFVFYSPLTRLWEFSAGVLVANFFKVYSIANKTRFGLKYLLSFLIIFLLFVPLRLTSELATTLIVFSVAFLIRLDYQENFSISRFLVWIGDRSYSIYLVHFPVVYLCKYSPLSNLGASILHQFLLLACIPLSVAIGSMVYQVAEKRILINPRELSAKFLIRYFSPALVAISIILFSSGSLFLWSVEKESPTYGGNPPKACKDFWARNELCEVGKRDASNSIVLAGDSHAGHFANALIQSVVKSNLKGFVWKDVSCIKTPVTFESISCRAIRSEFQSELVRIKPRVIFLSFYITKDVSLGLLDRFVSELKSKTNTIISIGQTPSFPESERYFESPLLFFKYPAPEKGFEISRMNNSYKQAYAEWERILANQDVSTIPTNDLFCDSSFCSRFIDGEWLYRDKNHLSLAGAQLLVPRFDQVLSSYSEVTLPAGD